jgi:phosphoenolpyruvate-protein kinase (PTS system EI component)
MGLRELSLEASSLPDVRAALEAVTVEEAQSVAEAAFECSSAMEVKAVLEERLGHLPGAPESG